MLFFSVLQRSKNWVYRKKIIFYVFFSRFRLLEGDPNGWPLIFFCLPKRCMFSEYTQEFWRMPRHFASFDNKNNKRSPAERVFPFFKPYSTVNEPPKPNRSRFFRSDFILLVRYRFSIMCAIQKSPVLTLVITELPP